MVESHDGERVGFFAPIRLVISAGDPLNKCASFAVATLCGLLIGCTPADNSLMLPVARESGRLQHSIIIDVYDGDEQMAELSAVLTAVGSGGTADRSGHQWKANWSYRWLSTRTGQIRLASQAVHPLATNGSWVGAWCWFLRIEPNDVEIPSRENYITVDFRQIDTDVLRLRLLKGSQPDESFVIDLAREEDQTIRARWSFAQEFR
jgi:hypothetical protein